MRTYKPLTCRILALSDMYAKDPNEKKVNLGIGASRDELGKPWILPAVQQVRTRVLTRRPRSS